MHVILEALVAQRLVGVDPGNHEHRVAAIDRPANEGILRLQIEDVELVDPRRHDQQRGAELRFRSRRVLDQLHHRILVDHRAFRGGNVAADLEGRAIGHRDQQTAVAGGEILEQHAIAAKQVQALFAAGCFEDFRIGQDEVRRR